MNIAVASLDKVYHTLAKRATATYRKLDHFAAYVRTRTIGIPKGAGRQWRPQNACILKRLTEPTGEKQPFGTRTLEQSLVCYTLPEVYSPSLHLARGV